LMVGASSGRRLLGVLLVTLMTGSEWSEVCVKFETLLLFITSSIGCLLPNFCLTKNLSSPFRFNFLYFFWPIRATLKRPPLSLQINLGKLCHLLLLPSYLFNPYHLHESSKCTCIWLLKKQLALDEHHTAGSISLGRL
jgi:hypothetical protein